MLRTGLASVAVVLLGGLSAAWLTQDFQVWTAEGARRLAVMQTPVPAPQATLQGADLTGEDLRAVLSAMPGRVTIASFIYTRCPGVCLALGDSFQQLQQALAAQADGRVSLLSLSFDPTHDDEGQLLRYAALWHADARYWHMVTVPDQAQLDRLLQAWQVVVIADGRGGYEHNAALLVIDARGRLVRIFDNAEPAAALAFARSLS